MSVVPKSYTVYFPVGDTTLSARIYPDNGIVHPSRMTVSELKSLPFTTGSSFVSFPDGSALFVIKGGVDHFMGTHEGQPTPLTTPSSRLQRTLDRLMVLESDFIASQQRVGFPFLSASDFQRDLTQLNSLHSILRSYFTILEHYGILDVDSSRAFVRCHLGAPAVLEIGGCQIPLDCGDLYLVAGSSSSAAIKLS
jgi:hypothetical protein